MAGQGGLAVPRVPHLLLLLLLCSCYGPVGLFSTVLLSHMSALRLNAEQSFPGKRLVFTFRLNPTSETVTVSPPGHGRREAGLLLRGLQLLPPFQQHVLRGAL